MSIPKRPQHCKDHTVYLRGCDACRLVAKKWERVRARERAYRGPIRVPADQARDHILRLVGQGMTPASIARAAGVSQTTTHNLHRGKRETIHRLIHNRIMGVTPTFDTSAYIPSLGLSRRVQHLYWMGHSGATIAKRADTTQSQVHEVANELRQSIDRDRHRRLMRTYQELWNVEGESVRARNTARRNGWVSIFAWDDPDTDKRPAKVVTGIESAHVARIETLADLAEMGEPWADHVVRRAGFSSLDYTAKVLRNHGRTDVEARLRRNSRLKDAS